MPRRGRASGPPPRSVRPASPTRAAPPPRAAAAPAPAAHPPAHAAPATPMVAQPAAQQPSLMGQMAATAGGVAIGSAVGHTIGHAVTGLFSGSSSEAAAAPAAAPVQAQSPSISAPASGACSWEVKQFLECAQNQSDLSLCEGFNEALRQCKTAHSKPDIIIVQSRKQPGMFGHIAGTAAGVAAGTVIGDKISGRNEPAASNESIPVDPANPCRYEEEQVLDCMQNQTNLQTCEILDEDQAVCIVYRYTTTTQDRKTNPINPKSSTGNFQNIASTAAGVAAGSVVGHVIGNVLSSGIGHGNSVNAGSSSDYSNVIEEICSPEIRQFFECASKNEDLDTCKSFHNTWFECQKRYSQHRSQA
ncbi:coiled-coil-helix-coiled-coil-helix domain-containing protein 2 [Vespula maculifrons]|uniref:Coiled-coil-helix-coiled-coil-helix domain-containing protein 2 n=1 Tax=Vespula maculifrons TaxID=7453 RepID=A0ABD2CUM0_VESMC